MLKELLGGRGDIDDAALAYGRAAREAQDSLKALEERRALHSETARLRAEMEAEGKAREVQAAKASKDMFEQGKRQRAEVRAPLPPTQKVHPPTGALPTARVRIPLLPATLALAIALTLALTLTLGLTPNPIPYSIPSPSPDP